MGKHNNNNNNNKRGFERKQTESGAENPKYVDVLEVDKPIAGQNFACFSFLSPEKILQKKELFLFAQFLKRWEVNKSFEKFSQFLNFLAFKYKLSYEEISKDLEGFIEEERAAIIAQSTVNDDYATFLDQDGDKLEKEFNVANQFQTSVRGVKVRGCFSTQEEAELRAKLLREADPNHDIFVGPVGVWLPYDPDAYKTGRVEYMEEELNQLVHEKIKNETAAKTVFEERVKETKKKAIEENKKNADRFGTQVTQDVDEDGTLFGVAAKGGSTVERSIMASASGGVATSDDVRAELFEGDNIVTKSRTAGAGAGASNHRV